MQVVTPKKHPGGRPRKVITMDDIMVVCDRIAAGEPEREVFAPGSLVTRPALALRMEEDEKIRTAVTRARQARGHVWFERAESVWSLEPERIDGGRIDPAWVQWQRVRAEIALKCAARCDPETFGDKIDVNGKGLILCLTGPARRSDNDG